MTAVGRRLFLYGTLQPGTGHPHSDWLFALVDPLGPARARGALWAIPDRQGWYPALVPGVGWVKGFLVAATSRLDAAAWARLDAFEAGYRRAALTLEDGSTVEAWVWAKDLPDGARPIAGGDYRAWLTETGLPPYRGA